MKFNPFSTGGFEISFTHKITRDCGIPFPTRKTRSLSVIHFGRFLAPWDFRKKEVFVLHTTMDKLATTKQTSNLETFFKLRLDLIKVSGNLCCEKKEGHREGEWYFT